MCHYTLYCLFHIVLAPLLALRSALRAGRRDYARSWWLRLSGGSRPPHAGPWTVFLAPHIGEAKVAARLARSVSELGEGNIVVLATVDSAVHAIQDTWTSGAAPFNNPIACLLFLRRWHPRAIVAIGSCDIPHLTALCALLGVPVVVLNTALTESQAAGIVRHGMRRWRWQTAALYATPTQAIADRLMRLGVPSQNVLVTGPLGSWPEPKGVDDATRQLWKKRLGLSPLDGPIVLAGSTHAEDEEMILPAFELLRRCVPNAVLVIAPRRPDRISALLHRLVAAGASYKLRSQPDTPLPAGRVIVLDTYGELEHLYAIADVAHVGGTFSIALGGHTPAEALAYSVPITVGPHYEQQHATIEPLLSDGVARRTCNARELSHAWEALLQDPSVRERVGISYARIRSLEGNALREVWQQVQAILTAASGSAVASDALPTSHHHSLR
ncbi:MAG: hypothetical protein AMXMBFR61_21780 [Fimbriimonadales bacterium]